MDADAAAPRNPLDIAPCQSNEEGKRDQLEIEIISVETIKPASPTPHHLRTFELSIFDILSFHFYMCSVYFYPNYGNESLMEKTQKLKQSLSETLTTFYPFAGRVKDEGHIDCNDDGVYYVEAKASDRYSLLEFLKEPDYKVIHQLLPFHPCSDELISQTYVTMVQITTFSCGGIAIGLYTSHKIADAYSHLTFFKAWAATLRGHPEEITPSFTSPLIFLPNIPQPPEAGLGLMPFYSNKNKCVVKRFMFPSSSIIALKKETGTLKVSRVMAVTGLIWKCVMSASLKRSTGFKRPYNLMIPVNIRSRSSPPMPTYAIGNLAWLPIVQCRPDEQDMGLDSIVELVKNAVGKVDGEFIETMKGEEGNLRIGEYLTELKSFCLEENAEYMIVTSLCTGGLYDADFGWGKPVWVSLGNADTDIPILRNVVFLMDTRFGNGIEAWVSLSEQDMAAFENHPELLAFASVNPNPLDHLIVASDVV